jgi:DNA polymerase III delta prime subunit
MENRKEESLSNIDNLLEAIENKGKVDEALELLQQKQVDDKYKGVYVVENMPAEYMPRWEMLSEAKQQDIIRRSKMYNFTKPGVLESFWSTINFEEAPIVESQQVNQDTYHTSIFKKMALLRKGY